MAMLLVRNNKLCIIDCYEERKQVQKAGARWDNRSKTWYMAFTPNNVEKLLNVLENPIIEESVEERLGVLEEKEAELNRIKKAAKKDKKVQLKIPGVKLPLYNYQKLGVMFSTTNGECALIADEMGLGKAQPLDAKILTPNGWVKIGDIKKGNIIYGSDGCQHKITGVFPQGKKKIYRVTFSDGSTTECCDEHLWTVNTPTRKNRGCDPKTMSLKEIMDSGLQRKNGKNGNRWNWYIPIVKPIQYTTRSESLEVLPPYVMGVLLGDGYIRRSSISFSTADEHIASKIQLELGNKWSVKKNTDYDYRISQHGSTKTNEIHKLLKKFELRGCYSHEKHIPNEYIYAPYNDRLSLLQGLMDTDGYVNVGKRGNAAMFCTTSEKLKEGVIEICNSLGGVVKVSEKETSYIDKQGNKIPCRNAWILCLSLPSDVQPFSLPRKKILYPNLREKYQPSRAIVDISYVGKKEAQCILIDSKDHLYVTDNYIVTHNTIQSIGSAVWLKSQGIANNCLVIVPAAVKWNWPLEIEKFTDIPYVVIDGSPDERIQQWLGNLVCRRLKNGKYVYETGDPFFTIVNYELIMEDLCGGRNITIKADDSRETQERKKKQCEKYALRAAKLKPVMERFHDIIIIDEAHAIKNHSSTRSKNIKKLKGKFRLALTGTPLDGKLEELHSVMEFVKPGLFANKTRFLQRHAEFDFWGRVKKYKRVSEVRDAIQPYFLRRLKKDVMKELPDKTYQNIYIELTPKERKLYKKISKGEHESTEDVLAVTKAIRCKQFCNHPLLVGEEMDSSKLKALLETLEELIKGNGQKVIIFSQYKEMLDIIDESMKSEKYNFLRIDGDTKPQRRASMQKDFNDDPSVDAIIGTEAMSTGLNLTGATYVINYDDNWAPAIMRQREDRAHRGGQKNAVTVINFVVRDTIEERIREVLYGKESVSVEALGDDTEEMVLKRLGPEELNKLV